jgi:hypothetical protein
MNWLRLYDNDTVTVERFTEVDYNIPSHGNHIDGDTYYNCCWDIAMGFIDTYCGAYHSYCFRGSP